MSPNRMQQLGVLFDQACTLSLEQLAPFLDEHCANDAELREELLSLLRHDSDHTSLDGPAAPVFRGGGSAGNRDLPPDFGCYKYLQRLGSGGFGEVYLAEQTQPVRRRVAIKLIKAGMDSRQVLARFQAERQALALMEHPGIAKILDAGTTPTGHPYFAMEHIRGIPITNYCDENLLGLRQRIELAIDVCRAVQHAHQKGIIHRDLKPSNILVTLREDHPAPVVIDFGIAKALDRPLTDQTLVTEMRAFLGTPEYVSPEQADVTGLDVDTRSDIYSLGVVIYELLTSKTPFDLRTSAVEEIRRVIREDDPPRPSTRLGTLGDTVQSVARSRGSDPKSLARFFAGDLDWIVLKCLEKDRTRRYDTASALADDLTRHLRDEPVLAGPPGLGYRLGKFVRRNRVAVSIAAMFVVAIAVGLGFAASGYIEARKERDHAARQTSRAEAVREFFVRRMLDAANPSLGGSADTPVVVVLDRAATEIGTAFPDQPDIEATIRGTLAEAYQKLGRYDEALQHVDVAVRLAEREPSIELTELLGWRLGRANILRVRGDIDLAEAELRPLLEEARSKLGDDHVLTMKVEASLGNALWSRSRFDEAGEIFERDVARKRARFGETHLETGSAKSRLALVRRGQDRLVEAIELYGDAIRILEVALSPDNPRTLKVKNNLAVALDEAGRHAEATALHREVYETRRRVLGDAHAHTAASLTNVARSLARQRDYAGAEALHRDALRSFRTSNIGEDTLHVLRTRRQIANMVKRQDRPAEAREIYLDVLQALEGRIGKHVELGYTLTSLGDLEARCDNHEAAAKYRGEGVDLHLELQGPVHRETVQAEDWLVHSLHALDQPARLREFRQAQVGRLTAACASPDASDFACRRLARVLLACEFDDLRDLEAAAAAANRAITLNEGADALALETLAYVERLAGRNDEATKFLIRAAVVRGLDLAVEDVNAVFKDSGDHAVWRERFRALIRASQAH